MANSYHHSVSSARRFGGAPKDYQPIHDFLDSTKSCWADPRHRAILHNTFGCFLVERIFGHLITLEGGKQVPTRLVAEQHLREDTGHVPSIQDWLSALPMNDWMLRGAQPLSRELDDELALAHVLEINQVPEQAILNFFWVRVDGALQPIHADSNIARLTFSRVRSIGQTEWFSGDITVDALFELLQPMLDRRSTC
jgi:hypothetical protein